MKELFDSAVRLQTITTVENPDVDIDPVYIGDCASFITKVNRLIDLAGSGDTYLHIGMMEDEAILSINRAIKVVERSIT